MSAPHHRGARFFGLQQKLTLAFLTVAVIVSAVTSSAFYQIAREQVRTDLRQRLGDIVGVAAEGLDAELLATITPALGMTAEPFLRMRSHLQAVRDGASDLKYVYTLRRGPDGDIRFIVDAEDDPADIAALDEIYDDASPLLRAHFDTLTGTVVEEDFYTDEWGTFLSGYAAIRLPDGTRVGILGADISAATVRAYERRVLWLAVGVFAGTLPLILLIGWGMGRTIASPIIRLDRGAQRIAEGDLDVRLRIERSDEIGTLANSFDHMARELAAGRRRIEEVAAKYRAIFDNAAEGIFQSTPDGELVTANRACLAMLGYGDLDQTRRQMHDLGTQVYADPQDRARLLAELRRQGSVDGFEARLRRADGSTFWAEISLHRVTHGDAPELLEGMLVDVTDRRQRQAAEREREAAKAASEAKSGFLANMSHEIRTPLNAVMGLTDLAMRTDLDERQRDYLIKIKAAGRSLLALINDILDFSKIEAGRLDLEQTAFSLDEVLASLTELFAYRAHEQGLELIVSAEPNVPRALVGDPVRLGQILMNLTGNAVKFTERGEVAVLVSLCATAPRPLADDEVALEIQVRDTGPGIPEDRLEAIFQSFGQADDSITRRHGGTGLGLAITRELVGLMGGEVRVDSRLGEGSRFTATLILRRQSTRTEPRPMTPVDLRGLRVLIVDDNATSREILVSQIESFQMIAVAAPSGEAALEILADPTRSFDLVLMDWRMPGLDGLETTRRIRTQLKLAKTPVVCMISAYAREDLMPPAERSVLDAFLHKPVNQSFLFDTIMGLFGHEEAVIADGLPRVAETSAVMPDFSGRRVLLAEDVELNREVAVEWLTSVGLEVDTVENGQQAVERADPERHAAVLMDLQMPVMDGLEATRLIRARTDRDRLPIIAMTAHALKGDMERCLDAGMNDYVTKPIDAERLFAVLQRWIPGAAGAANAAPASSPLAGVDRAWPDGLDLPGIDVAEGLARANQNVRLYVKLLHRFRRDWANAAEQIEEALSRSDIEEAMRLAHSLKGVAGNLGAQRLFDRAADIEARIRDRQLPLPTVRWGEFVRVLGEVSDGLANLPEQADPKWPSETAGEIDEATLVTNIKDLIRSLDDDLDDARTRLARLRPRLIEHVGPARIAELEAQIDDFDIDAAIATLRMSLVDLAAND
jgi:PAS domain S-box-containing protein